MTSSGELADSASLTPAYSPDGARIAFISWATNLVTSDTNGASDIFVKTLRTGAIRRVSTSTDGRQVKGQHTGSPVFSADGSRLMFTSDAGKLVQGDTNDDLDVFVKHLGSGHVARVSTTADDQQANGASDNPAFSPIGNQVAFASQADNLVAPDTSGSDLFVKSLLLAPSAPRAVTGTARRRPDRRRLEGARGAPGAPRSPGSARPPPRAGLRAPAQAS